MHGGGHEGAVQVQPELLLQEVLPGRFEEGLGVDGGADGVEGSDGGQQQGGEGDGVGEVGGGANVAELGHHDGGEDEEGADILEAGDLALEDELVEGGGEDGSEGDEDVPDRGRDQRQAVEVDVVVNWGRGRAEWQIGSRERGFLVDIKSSIIQP